MAGSCNNYFFYMKRENLPSLRRAARALRYSFKIKKLVRGELLDMRLLSSTEYLNVQGEIKLLEREINLLLCRTTVLQYFNNAVPQNSYDFSLCWSY